MALAPTRPGGFLQSSGRNRVQRNLSNFRLRTGQRFPDQARQQLFEQQLVEDQADKQQQARTALAFRDQQFREDQASEGRRVAGEEQARNRRERKKAESFDPIKTVSTIAKVFT